MASSHCSLKTPCNQSGSNRQFILFATLTCVGVGEKRGSRLPSCGCPQQGAGGWFGLHVLHEVEVIGGVAVVITVLQCLLVMRRSAMRLIFPREQRIKALKLL